MYYPTVSVYIYYFWYLFFTVLLIFIGSFEVLQWRNISKILQPSESFERNEREYFETPFRVGSVTRRGLGLFSLDSPPDGCWTGDEINKRLESSHHSTQSYSSQPQILQLLNRYKKQFRIVLSVRNCIDPISLSFR